MDKVQDMRDIQGECNRAYIEVDLDAIAHNARNMRERLAPGTKLVGVVKTDAYGHGSVPVARALEEPDYMWGFAVATAEEAFELRDAGIEKPILILGYTFPYCYEQLARLDIRPAVFRRDSLEQLQAAAERAGKPIRAHIKVDTGMSRVGISPDGEGLKLIDDLRGMKGIEVEGIFTHFATADEADKSMAMEQLETFERFAALARERLGREIPLRHCSNSAGILEMRRADMDLVRVGISLYGIYPSDETDRGSVRLEPALSLYSRIVYIKTIHAGQSVSYGATFRADRDMRVATVPLGYGDGYPRSLSGKGHVLICGKPSPILGRICMDQFMTDVSDIPDAKEGDRVVLIGSDGGAQISAEDLGELSGRFHYELLCDFSRRVPRVYRRLE